MRIRERTEQGAKPKENGGRAGRAVPLATNLALLEERALAKVRRQEAVDRRLHGTADGLQRALEVVIGHAAGAKDVAVGKVLCGQVTDRKLVWGHITHAPGRQAGQPQ